jgi:predicted AlkP superfamily pyrophosphatase or phosphodiesterase
MKFSKFAVRLLPLLLVTSTVFAISPKNKTLIVFFDGLRPDYITPEEMPNLYAFAQVASKGNRHHSVFPTVTRVNSASYSTGSYPKTHGLLGNTIYIPEISTNKGTGTSYADLSKIPAATSGPILTTLSLGEILKTAGESMMVFSSGTTGQAFLQNPSVSGAIINPNLILPESFRTTVTKDIGAPPADPGHGGFEKHRWITDGLLKYGLQKDGPLVSAIWYSDPDGSAHEHGIASNEAVASLAYVDAQFGRILAALKKLEPETQFNILISTDHGFVTLKGKTNLTDFLLNSGLKKNKDSDDIVVAEGAIYVKNHDKNVIKSIVSALHKEEWVGAVFTPASKKGDTEGWVNGTLSFDAIHYNHPRAGDILVSTNWTDEKNDKGYAGTGYATGVAGHGGSSTYEINIALFAKGPDFKNGVRSDLPTSNIDIIPTILQLYQLPVPPQMDGRAISELLDKKQSAKAPKVKTQILRSKASYPWGSYEVEVARTHFDNRTYIDYAKANRTIK